MTESLLTHYKDQISEVSCIPSSGGVFEVVAGDTLIYSKKEKNRFPEPNEVEEAFASRMAK